MLTRSLVRLWTPKYFRGQRGSAAGRAARHLGPRRTRTIDSATPAGAAHAQNNKATAGTQRQQTAKLNGSHTHEKIPLSRQDSPKNSSYTPGDESMARAGPASSAQVDAMVQVAQDLLMQLSHPSSTPAASAGSPSSAALPRTAEATRNYVAFTARRDVLAPLRQRLQAAPAHLSTVPSHLEAVPRPSSSSSALSHPGAAPRLRVISSTDAAAPLTGADASPPQPFTLAELVVFLQLYDAVGAEDGVLLVQLMAEVHRELFAYAAAQQQRRTTRHTTPSNLRPSASSRAAGEASSLDAAASTSREGLNTALAGGSAAAALPLPTLLFTMSSLGLVEEAVLDLITSAAHATDTSPARRGLLYRQLPLYSTEELVTLIIALHRFGHAQQPSMKAATKALRASLYHTPTPAGAFHRTMKEVKKRLGRAAGAASAHHDVAPPGHEGDGPTDGVVRTLQTRPELAALVLQMRCPLFLLLEALTAAALTVYRRTDVVSFLSDLIAVTAAVELSMAMAALPDRATPRFAISTASQPPREDAQAYAAFVAHQLLRAAKLTEEIEQPQPLLSAVFAWSCTQTGKGVVVDGGEDNDVPSERIAYYDHVTADLIKVNRTD